MLAGTGDPLTLRQSKMTLHFVVTVNVRQGRAYTKLGEETVGMHASRGHAGAAFIDLQG